MSKLITYALWDFNGVIATIDAFWDYFHRVDPELHDAWKIKAASDPKLKAELKNRVVPFFESATDKGLYEMNRMPGALEALSESAARGYTNTIFSTMNPDLVKRKLGEFEVQDTISRVITLDEVLAFGSTPGLVKEDPRVYVHLAHMLQCDPCTIRSYVDDSEKRIQAASQANATLASNGGHGINHLFHFDPKSSDAQCTGYKKISHLQDALLE